jgi:hypothetical protein
MALAPTLLETDGVQRNDSGALMQDLSHVTIYLDGACEPGFGQG